MTSMDKTSLTRYMNLAIQNAEKARGKCSPNPYVGAVIVKNGKVISTGWTQSYGEDHAEVQAIKKAGKAARGADIYVTLEPCSHYGKTPPCALAVIKAGIKRVFVGIEDPNPLVSGKGMDMLKNAGIGVQQGLLKDKITRQLEEYLCYIKAKRPFVTLKTALSLDGKFAASDGSSRWITGEKTRRYVHKLRSEHDVILTGIKTVLVDDPLLNVRLPGKPKQPLRAVLDPLLQIPVVSKLVQSAPQSPVLVFCSIELPDSDKTKKLEEMGVQLCRLAIRDGLFEPADVLNELYNRKHYSVMLETGSLLAESFLRAGLVDKLRFFYGPLLIGGENSPFPTLGVENMANAIKLKDITLRRFEDDIMLTAYPVWD